MFEKSKIFEKLQKIEIFLKICQKSKNLQKIENFSGFVPSSGYPMEDRSHAIMKILLKVQNLPKNGIFNAKNHRYL